MTIRNRLRNAMRGFLDESSAAEVFREMLAESEATVARLRQRIADTAEDCAAAHASEEHRIKDLCEERDASIADFAEVAIALGCIYEQSMGANRAATSAECVMAVEALRAEAKAQCERAEAAERTVANVSRYLDDRHNNYKALCTYLTHAVAGRGLLSGFNASRSERERNESTAPPAGAGEGLTQAQAEYLCAIERRAGRDVCISSEVETWIDTAWVTRNEHNRYVLSEVGIALLAAHRVKP